MPDRTFSDVMNNALDELDRTRDIAPANAAESRHLISFYRDALKDAIKDWQESRMPGTLRDCILRRFDHGA